MEAMSDPLTVGSHPPIAYFSETLRGSASLRLAAAVVWRGAPTPSALRGGGGPLGWLRTVRHRLWLRLGPLGADVSVARRPLFGGAWGAARRVGSIRAASHAEPLAYYDDGTHRLRVLGRVVQAPAGRTLVALIDATGQRAAAPRLTLRFVPTPTIPVPRLGSAPVEEDGAAVSYMFGGEQPVWETALRADPLVRAFLDDDRTD
jgi:hypothetical protein